MSRVLGPSEDQLTAALAEAARGPKRNSIFAIWLFTRVADGLLPPRLSGRARRRRLEALQHRVSSLSMPAPLRRALAAGFGHLGGETPASAVVALQQLVAPARDTAGPAVGDALALAARTARRTVKEEANG